MGNGIRHPDLNEPASVQGRPFTAHEKRKAAERELAYRRYVYPARVEGGKMTRSQAEREIAVMEAIRDDYAKLEVSERLL